MTWQQANIQAAAAYMRERIAGGATDPKTIAVYEGLIEVLDPPRRGPHGLQRESAIAAKAAVAVQSERDRRARNERRAPRDRRRASAGALQGVERRGLPERRSGVDRRNRG